VTGFATEAYAAPCHVDNHDHGRTAGIRFQKPAIESKYAYQFTYPHLLCGDRTGLIIMQHDGTIQTWDGGETLHGSSAETRYPIPHDDPKSTGMVAVLKELCLTTAKRHRANTDTVINIDGLKTYHS
jgi:hypothetical protein